MPLFILVNSRMHQRDAVRVLTAGYPHPFRLFVRARDGRWYKQQTPVYSEGFAIARVQFGADDAPRLTPYTLVALAADEALPNVFDFPPVALLRSRLHEVRRV